jgi:hypothetical protein
MAFLVIITAIFGGLLIPLFSFGFAIAFATPESEPVSIS